MKAIQIQEPGKAVLIDVPVPVIAEDEVLVKVVCCVTCPHWDLTLFKGVDIFGRPGYPKYPIPWGYPGHEMSGEVVAVGDKVRKLQVGDRVATLYTAGEDKPGFYCEFINREEAGLAKLPDRVSFEAGANMEMCRFMSPYIRLLGDVAGKRTGVTGLGPAGLIALQMLKASGAAEIVAVDILPPRLALAAELGATETVNSSTSEIETLSANPLFATIDCTGIAAGLQTALDHTSARVSVFGVPHGDAVYTTRHWGVDILSRAELPGAVDTEFVLDLWRKRRLDTEALVSVKLPFSRYEDGIDLLRDHRAIKIGFYPG